MEVVAAAKRDLGPGDVLDGIGWYMTYGLCENAGTARAEDLLPMGVAEGCTVTQSIAKDQVLTYADVEVPPGRLTDALLAEQRTMFANVDG